MNLRTHPRSALFAALLVLPFAVASCHTMIDFDGYKVAPAETEGSGGAGGGAGTSGSGGAGRGGGAVTSGDGGGGGPASACGDGTIDPGEQCDDANDEDNDGCSRTCTYEFMDGCPEVALWVGTENVHLRGDTTNAAAEAEVSCSAPSGEYIIKVRPLVNGTLKATMTAQYTAVFWAATDCPAAGVEIVCRDAVPLGFTIPVHAGVDVYLAADGDGAAGAFDMDLLIVP